MGQLDGVATLQEVKRHGDFGLGSRHALAGELVLVNGKAYHISIDGKAVVMPDSAKLPFAAAKFFRPEKTFTLKRSLNLEELQSLLDSLINTSLFSAVKISGSFSSIQYKCFYPQSKPYKPIAESSAKFFDSTNITGTMAGFFTPKSAIVLNSPNYHFHFINEAGSSGGHVEGCITKEVTIQIDYANGLHVMLPPEESLTNINLNEPVKE